MERKDYAQKFLDIKNEIVEEIRKLVPEDSAHKFSDKFYVHYVEGEVATTEVCSAVEVWSGGMVVFIVNTLKEFAKEEVIEGETIFQYAPESFLDILDHLKKELYEKKLLRLRDIVKKHNGTMTFDGFFEFVSKKDDEGKANLCDNFLYGLELTKEGKLEVITHRNDGGQEYEYHTDCIRIIDDDLDRLVDYVQDLCKKKFSIYVHGSYGRVFDDIEAETYEEALAIAQKMWDNEPLNKEDSDGEDWEPWNG